MNDDHQPMSRVFVLCTSSVSRGGFLFALLLSVLACALTSGEAFAGPRVDVIVADDAPKLERFAADELQDQFKRLFDADVQISDTVPDEPVNLILIGSPGTNPAIKRLVKKNWPKLSDEGHLVRSIQYEGKRALVVGGGSPVATLWAVYELGHRFGIRYVLFGDMFPATLPELKFEGIDILLEPAFRVRTWRGIDDSPVGSESWGLAEHEQVIKQLAKLKFNRVLLSVHPWQPFVDFESNDIKKQTGVLFHGQRFPVDGDTGGRAAFKGAKFFENPDFAGKAAYAERIQAGTKLARGIFQAARRLGMTTALSFSPLDFPPEFAPLITGEKEAAIPDNLTVIPDTPQRLSGEPVKTLLKNHIRAYINTYPEIDTLFLTFRENEVLLYLKDKTLTDIVRLSLWNGTHPRIVATGIDPTTYPVLEKIVLPRIGVQLSTDESARKVAEKLDLLKQVPVKTLSAILNLNLSGDNAGILPSMSHSSLKVLVDQMHAVGWDEFVTCSGAIGDLDFSVYYLSRASFSPDITTRQALDDLVTPALGDGTLERTLKAFDLIEQATTLIDQNDPKFALPFRDIALKHYSSSDPVPEWWGRVKGHYLAAMDEMYRVNTRAREGNRSFSLYLARRLEFGAEYFNCIEAVRKAGIAKSKGDKETQVAELEKAVESLDAALNALAAVARSNSDRGVIAVLNEWGYRPLKKELEAQ